jgi:hypothetical protein
MDRPPGRRLVIAGWILLGIAAGGSVPAFVLSVVAAVSVVNVGFLVGLALFGVWAVVAYVLYAVGLLLLVTGRSRQRGPVKAQMPALIIAVGAPLLALGLWSLIGATSPPDVVALIGIIASLVCLAVTPAAAAWAIWGAR